MELNPSQPPAIYTAPNYKSLKAQTATVDTSPLPLAKPEQKRELQVIIGTLLYYYARTVDPSILTAVHELELGSIQSNPTLHDRQKAKR